MGKKKQKAPEVRIANDMVVYREGRVRSSSFIMVILPIIAVTIFLLLGFQAWREWRIRENPVNRALWGEDQPDGGFVREETRTPAPTSPHDVGAGDVTLTPTPIN